MRAVQVLALIALPLAVACSPKKNVWQAGIPGVGTTFTVSRIAERGPVLQAWLAGPSMELETFLRADDTCRAMFVEGKEVVFRSQPPGGRFTAGETNCPAVGIGSLRNWRDRTNRGSAGSRLVPRAQSTFRVLYRDDDVVFLRGRFPLTGQLGWTGGEDTVAVVPNDASCEQAVAAGVASMEFRAKGTRTLALTSGGGLCPIQGLILAEVWR